MLHVQVVTPALAAAIDERSVEGGNPSRALMQRAGHAAASEISLRYGDRLGHGVAIFAGPGNNGGDAWVVAGALAATGVHVTVHHVPPATPDARAEFERATSILELETPSGSEGVVVDGLLGTGATGAPRPPISTAIGQIEQMRRRGSVVVALDVPSGLDSFTGESTTGVTADLTLSFGTAKRGQLLNRGKCGALVVLDIGLGAAARDADAPRLLDRRWVLARVPPISPDAHKGTRRKLAIVGGSLGMSGAASLASAGAYRSGIGLVRLVVQRESLSAVQSSAPHATAVPWPATSGEVMDLVGTWADAVVIGPGLGTGVPARSLVEQIAKSCDIPLVVDADALNVFAGEPAELGELLRGRKVVVTPHPIEMARLAGISPNEVIGRRFEIAAEFASSLGVVVLLKGVPSVIAAPDGRTNVSAAGSPALAVGGSGDILAGILGTMLAQTEDPFVAASCAAWLHGRAGELAVAHSDARGRTLDHVLSALSSVWSDAALPPRYPILAELPSVGE